MSKSRRKKRAQAARPAPAPLHPALNLAQIETAPWFLPALALCGLIMGVIFFDANLGLSGDNAQFINLGRSIAAGHGLSETLGDAPIPHTKYPFGFPLLLAVVERIFPGNLVALKGLVVLLYVLAIPLVYKLIRCDAGPVLSFAVAALCLISPPLLDFSHQVMSEIPFLPAALLALILLHRAHRAPTWSNLALTVIAIMAAYYIRSAGLVLVGTGVLFFALHKRWKETAVIAGGCFALALPWYLRNAALGGNDYIHQLLSVDPYRPEQGLLTLGGLFERIGANLKIYGLLEIPRVFVPPFATTPGALLGIVFSGLVLYALVAGLRRRSLLAVYLICYIGLILLWPQVWSDIRFLIPAVPVLFYAVFAGVSDLADRVNAMRPICIALFLLLAGSNIYAAHDLSERIGHFPPNWKNYFEAGEWIRDNTASDVKIACRKPFLMNATANRKTTGYIWASPEEVIKDFEKNRVDIVVIDQIGFASTPQYLIPAVQKYRDRFDVLHIVRNPDTYILKFHRAPSP